MASADDVPWLSLIKRENRQLEQNEWTLKRQEEGKEHVVNFGSVRDTKDETFWLKHPWPVDLYANYRIVYKDLKVDAEFCVTSIPSPGTISVIIIPRKGSVFVRGNSVVDLVLLGFSPLS
jgi:hypothetical protein